MYVRKEEKSYNSRDCHDFRYLKILEQTYVYDQG